ncbi:hypothetical protein F5148DRAFT_1145989 [Russula earlei]|uniref:Uncharacterized protein n=1 Tax=Russula earlei TaxID=71964 RepID=A0ACC0UNK8_9AGAM|nr:hypothetical protein F5148DRAFT_1145989 [Russula earlei]
MDECQAIRGRWKMTWMTSSWMISYTLPSLLMGFGAASLVPVPQRGVKSVFYHVRRARDPLAKAGKWGAAEDEQLRSDRFRQHTQYQGIRRRDLLTLHLYGKGAWSSEEEGQLHHAIEELAREDVMSPHNMDRCNETAATFHNNHWILNAGMKEACKFGMTTRGRYIWTDRGMGLAETGILQ